MHLGAFSISLSVKDLAASRAFYETLGFQVTGGNQEHNWLILRNGETTIGLFHGMFEGNALTFNPGWRGSDMATLSQFDDVRSIQAHLQAQGITLLTTVDPNGTDVAHITLEDPDGNSILIDQHVPRPG